jgi:hypothetical protein
MNPVQGVVCFDIRVGSQFLTKDERAQPYRYEPQLSVLPWLLVAANLVMSRVAVPTWLCPRLRYCCSSADARIPPVLTLPLLQARLCLSARSLYALRAEPADLLSPFPHLSGIGKIVAITRCLQQVKLPQRVIRTLPPQMQHTIQFLSD